MPSQSIKPADISRQVFVYVYSIGKQWGLNIERHKTIILLRLSTVAELRPEGGAKRAAQGFAGEPPRRFIARQRTQQNKNFVAFEDGLCYNISRSEKMTDKTNLVLCLYNPM